MLSAQIVKEQDSSGADLVVDGQPGSVNEGAVNPSQNG